MNTIKIKTLKKVKSSNIELIGFNEGVTFIKFKNGSLYEYPNTTVEEFTALSEADSVGKEFFKSFKKKEEFTMLEDSQLEEIVSKGKIEQLRDKINNIRDEKIEVTSENFGNLLIEGLGQALEDKEGNK